MTRETELATRGPVVEGAITPRQVGPDADAGIARAGRAAAAGRLPGHHARRTSPKSARLGRRRPACWRAGSTAWGAPWPGPATCAAAGPGRWLQWPGTAQLFSELVGWTIAPAQGPLRLSVRADAANGHIDVQEATPERHARSGAGARRSARRRAAQELDLPATGPGQYGGSFPLNGPGTYIVRVDEQRDGRRARPRPGCRCRIRPSSARSPPIPAACSRSPRPAAATSLRARRCLRRRPARPSPRLCRCSGSWC